MFVCEGFATGASIHEATGVQVIIAFDTGNLLPVVEVLRSKHPESKIVICADNDQWIEGNPGATKAGEAARAVGAKYVLPRFKDLSTRPTDFNDLATLEGLQEVRSQLAHLCNIGKPLLNMLCAADIRPEPISWVWNGYIACGKVHILAGPAGHGKTTVLLALGATITIGGRFPDGTRPEVGDIAIWSGEDDPADTLVPRLIACGADLRRVHIIRGVIDRSGQRPFDPATDMQILRANISEMQIQLLIIDPIVSAVGGDSHKNAETRRALQPVVDLAAELDVAVYGVTHFTKGTSGRDPVERITGSLAFGALTRLVTVAMKMPDEGNHPKGARLFARAKSNIGLDGGGFFYFLEVCEVPGHPGIMNTRVLWGDQVEGTARELLARAESLDGDNFKTREATEWLRESLADGPRAAKELLDEARRVGISRTTLQRAKDGLKVKSSKVGFARGWGWYLPEDSAEDSIHPEAESSGKNTMQVIDSVEDSAKVPKGRNLGGVGIFYSDDDSAEDSDPTESSQTSLNHAGLGAVETSKIPRPTVLESSDDDGIFGDDDEVVL